MNMKVNKKTAGSSKKKRTCPSVGQVTISCSFNNTIVTIADLNGQVIASASGGSTQKGTRKATPHAAQEAAKIAGKKVLDMGMLEVKAILKGFGSARDSALRGLSGVGLKILTIADRTPHPHGGVRKRKKKRV